MPTILRLLLTPRERVVLKTENAPAHGWFLRLAEQIDSAWGEALHRGDGALPYSLSSFYLPREPRLETEDDHLSAWTEPQAISAGGVIALRIGMADDRRAALLLEKLPHLTREGTLPPLGGAPCSVMRYPEPIPGDPDLLHASWEILETQAPDTDRFQVRFVTPTYITSRGVMSPLPEPARLLASWQEKWRAGTGNALPEALSTSPAELADGLRVSEFDIRSQSVRRKGGIAIGAVGVLEASFAPDTFAPQRRAVTALAAVADFLGTGAKSTMGLGQTRFRCR